MLPLEAPRGIIGIRTIGARRRLKGGKAHEKIQKGSKFKHAGYTSIGCSMIDAGVLDGFLDQSQED